MSKITRRDADYIINKAIAGVLPDEAVAKALKDHTFSEGRLLVVAIGKAGWQMAQAASNQLGDAITAGVVVTKYNHVKGEISRMTCYEAGHPVPDENSFRATQAAIELVSGLTEKDTVLFLVSGGGSALFEKPLISGERLAEVTKQLLGCGANIVEMNTIRKRLSEVKGGKFAKLCEPAQVFSIVLSDVLGDPLDMIASGPAYPDQSTCKDALEIVKKYHLEFDDEVMECLKNETPKQLSNVETVITGSVRELCKVAKTACEELGYKTQILTDQLDCEAREAGAFLAAIARSHGDSAESLAFIAGGETIVHLTGEGKGGRNQELALSGAMGIAELRDVAIFSIGSDGTDGPTDAAGGYCDEETLELLTKLGVNPHEVLQKNDAYHALEKCGGLVITGPTGTNVNDVAVILIKRKKY